jgi:hypothetical protein
LPASDRHGGASLEVPHTVHKRTDQVNSILSNFPSRSSSMVKMRRR